MELFSIWGDSKYFCWAWQGQLGLPYLLAFDQKGCWACLKLTVGKNSYLPLKYLILVQLPMHQCNMRRKSKKMSCRERRLLCFCSGAVQQDCHSCPSHLHCFFAQKHSSNSPSRKEIKTSLSWNSWTFLKLSTISRGSGSSLSVQYMAVSSASN